MTILASTPSSTASTSIVALSVSISASTSPACTGSPTFLTQRAILPSVIVGDSAGISTSLAIYSSESLADPGPPPVAIRLRPQPAHPSTARSDRARGSPARIAPLRSRYPERASRSASAHPPGRNTRRAGAGANGRLGRAHAVHFVLGPVFRRIGHRVAAIAVGQHLYDDRPLPGAGMLGGFEGGLMHRDDVHAVDLLAGNAVGDAAVVEVGAGRGAADRGPHAVAVVLDDIDDRQLP